MEPYAAPNEPKVGSKRPKIEHRAEEGAERRTRAEREGEKREVTAERRAIKKSARRHLKAQMVSEISEAS